MERDEFILLEGIGDDMEPSITNGEKLLLEKTDPSDICIGDVIVFQGDILIAHRVIEKIRFKSKYYFFTRGDTCRFLDLPVSEKKVMGKVVGKSYSKKKSLISSISLRLLLLFYLADTSLFNNRMKCLRTYFLKFISIYLI